MVSKKTSGIVIYLLSELGKAKRAHCIRLADGNGVKKNEWNCYLFAVGIGKSQNVVRASPRRHKTILDGLQKKRAFYFLKNARPRMLSLSEKNTKNVLMLVFFGPFTRFFHFLNSGKIRKMSEKSHFFQFFLMLCAIFYKLFALCKKLTFL